MYEIIYYFGDNMEINDILNLLNSDTPSKIGNLFTNIFSQQNNSVSTPSTFSSSYWQLPSYSTQTSPPPSQNQPNTLLELLKLLLPLLSHRETKKPETKSDFKSSILSLTKVD